MGGDQLLPADELFADVGEANSEFCDRGADHEGAVVGEVHSLVHGDGAEGVAGLGGEGPCPVEGSAGGGAAGGGGEVVGGGFELVVAEAADVPFAGGVFVGDAE